MISLRSSLPLLNGMIFPPAPEFVQNRIFPFIAFCVDPYLNKVRCPDLPFNTCILLVSASVIPPQGSIPILARGRRPRRLSGIFRHPLFHRLHAGHRHGAPRPAPSSPTRIPPARFAPRQRSPRVETFLARNSRVLPASLAPIPLNAVAAGRRRGGQRGSPSPAGAAGGLSGRPLLLIAGAGQPQPATNRPHSLLS